MIENRADPEPLILADCILIHPPARTPADIIALLGARLLQQGFVRADFIQAVTEREQHYPTGLPTVVPTALPHTEPQHCLRPALAAAVLDPPVPFRMMGQPESVVEVEIVFLLCLPQPGSQLDWLEKWAEFLQDAGGLAQLKAARTASEAAQLLRKYIRVG